jgi:hypothetical protein
VEEVKSEYAQKLLALEHSNKLVLDQLQQRLQLSLAAVDLRLAAHQRAFAMTYELFDLAHDDKAESYDRLNQILQWWRDNCLYLAPDAAAAFITACGATGAHRALLKGGDREILKENWKKIEGASEAIAAAVQLPGIGVALVQSAKATNEG